MDGGRGKRRKRGRKTGTGGWRYLGMDTSVAPGLDTPPLTSAIEQLLGPGRSFGQAGTLGACAAITAALKGLPLRRTGYCGLMLAVCEDKVGAETATAAAAQPVGWQRPARLRHFLPVLSLP